MSDTYDVTWGFTVTKKNVPRPGIPLFIDAMNKQYGTIPPQDGTDVKVTIPSISNPPALKEIPRYSSGRTTHRDSADNYKYQETMEAMIRSNWDHRLAADDLQIGLDTIRSRLYAYLRKKLVRKVSQDKWGSIYA